jgi:hypothetical protein
VQAELAALPVPRITFNYLGQFDGSFAAEDGALFVPAGEAVGPDQSPLAALGNWLTLNGQVYGGEFSMGWRFSTQMFDEATVQRLADDYGRELEALVEHCCCLQSARRRRRTSRWPAWTWRAGQPAGAPGADRGHLPAVADAAGHAVPHPGRQRRRPVHQPDQRAGAGLDLPRFEAAWNQVIARHEILRTGFCAATLAQPLQLVRREARLPLQVIDWRDREADPAALQAVAAAGAKGFDLLQAPLTRITLVRTAEDAYQPIWTSHHILMDGWSTSRLLGEVFQAAGQALPERQGRYRDYIDWLQRQSAEADEQFWRARLADLDGPTLLAGTLAPQPAPGESGHGALYLNWDAAATARLKAQAQRLR